MNREHALDQLKFKFCHRIVKKELRLLAKYIDHGGSGNTNFIPFKLNFTGDQPISTIEEAKEFFPMVQAGQERLRDLWRVHND